MKNESYLVFLFILVAVLVLLSMVAVFYLYITARNRERLALIEKGMDPNLSRSDFWTQVGIIGGGIPLGLMAGDLFPGKFGPLFALLFAGAGLVVYNIWKQAKMRRNSGV